ncbi:MAG: hypothetical protein JW717_01865 [Marinilabiliaceae bacterium]|nr:hypothetical protein [Marinilabiliaceae bacterium]
MSKVIIGIHGLGNKPEKDILQEWWKKSMHEGLRGIGEYNLELPKFELVYWADVLYAYPLTERIKDKSDPYHLEEKYTESPQNFIIENHNTRKKIVNFINQQLNKIFLNPDYSLNYSFITDNILHQFFKDLEIYFSETSIETEDINCKAKGIIQNRLYTILKKYQHHDIFLIGHSMGSIIAYDVLSYIMPEANIHTFITIGSPLGLPVVVGKMAAEEKKTFNKEVEIMRTPPGIKKHWYNFADILDKVALNYELSDDFGPNEQGIKPIDFLVTNTYTVNETRNPHKSYGYLRTPEFSKILSYFIKEENKDFNQKIKIAFNQITEKITDAIKSINQS